MSIFINRILYCIIAVQCTMGAVIIPLCPGSQCVDKLYAGVPDVSIPLNVFSSWGGLSCYIKLTSAPGSVIRLTVKSFRIDPSDCVYDALTVYDSLLPMRGMILYR